MRDLALDALEIVENVNELPPRGENARRLRDFVSQARGLLSDAGYPAEAAWQGLQRASIGANTAFDEYDLGYWTDVADDLHRGVDTLQSLVSPHARPDTDIHVVG
jgi:hypothetical protein